MHEGYNDTHEEQSPEDRHLEQAYAQYIEDEDAMYFALLIQKMLQEDENSTIKFLQDGDREMVSIYAGQYNEVREVFEGGHITKKAPWYTDLENRLLSLSLYITHAASPEELALARASFHQKMQEGFARKHPDWKDEDEEETTT